MTYHRNQQNVAIANVSRRGAPEGATYTFFGDEHGKLILPEGVAKSN